jgi:hypothetical protein
MEAPTTLRRIDHPRPTLERMLPQQHFHFLDLPAELRLMVYDNLPVTIIHHTLAGPLSPSTSAMRLVTKSMPVQVFLVCREIYQEAEHHLRHRLASCRRLQFIIDSACMRTFAAQYIVTEERTGEGILTRIMNTKRTVQFLMPTRFGDLVHVPEAVARDIASFVVECREHQKRLSYKPTPEIVVSLKGDVPS